MKNWGLLRRIAMDLGVSRQFVSAVFRGKKRSARVEAALREARAPGFDGPKKKAAAA